MNRIDNLEFRKATYLCESPEHPAYDIIMWYPNCYYGKESEYIYDERNDCYCPPEYPHCYISKSCFKHPESCMTIASFEYDKNEDFYEFHFCGNRPIEMPKDYRETFWELIEFGDKYLNTRKEEEDD